MSALGLTDQEVRDLRTVFAVFDASGAGVIEREDVRKALKVLGFRVSRHVVEEMVRDVDVRGEMRGKVDFDGFCQVVAKQQGSSYDSHGEIMQAFHYIDSDGDQMISVEDLKRTCSETKLKLSEAEIQGMLDEADVDGDGRVNQQEFIKVMLKTTLFSNQRIALK